MYFYTVYPAYAVSEWCPIFKYLSFFLLSACIAAASALLLTIFMVPVTSIYACLLLHKLYFNIIVLNSI